MERIIKTENDYRTALKRMELLFDVPVNTPDSDETDILSNCYEIT